MCYSLGIRGSLDSEAYNMNFERLRLPSIALLAVCLTPAGLSASTILYSDFDPANYSVSGAYNTGSFNGTTFTTTGGGILGAVLLAVAVNQSSPAALTLGLYADSSGQPGALLESWTITFPGANNPPITNLASLQNPFLTAGKQYWLVAAPASVGVVWVFNNQGIVGGLGGGTSLNGMSQHFASSPAPAIQLNAVVPEPGSAILAGLGCIAMIAMRKHRGAAAAG